MTLTEQGSEASDAPGYINPEWMSYFTDTEPAEAVPEHDGVPLEPKRPDVEDGKGMERPSPLFSLNTPTFIGRTFVFVDLCGFTRFTKVHGASRSTEILTVFRAVLRDIASRRDVRVAKWLGDGAMVVSIRPGRSVAFAAELVGRFSGSDLQLRAGVAAGEVLLFEGDDYIGEAVNLASRLCDAAQPGEILSSVPDGVVLPEWVEPSGRLSYELPGFGAVDGVRLLSLSPDVELPGPRFDWTSRDQDG